MNYIYNFGQYKFCTQLPTSKITDFTEQFYALMFFSIFITIIPMKFFFEVV